MFIHLGIFKQRLIISFFRRVKLPRARATGGGPEGVGEKNIGLNTQYFQTLGLKKLANDGKTR